MKSFTNDPQSAIYEYFFDIKRKIDIDRETTMKKMDDHYLGLFEELDTVEKSYITACYGYIFIYEFEGKKIEIMNRLASTSSY